MSSGRSSLCIACNTSQPPRIKGESERMKGHTLVHTEREKFASMYGVLKDNSLGNFKKDY